MSTKTDRQFRAGRKILPINPNGHSSRRADARGGRSRDSA